MTKILQALHEGLIIRHDWTGNLPDGRETACLLVVVAPECGVARSAGACPADILPPWMAKLVPLMNDSGTDSAWRRMVIQFDAALTRWKGSTPADWERRHCLTRAIVVREAMRHTTTSPSVLAICEKVASTLESGQWPDEELQLAARTAAADAMFDVWAISAIVDAAADATWVDAAAAIAITAAHTTETASVDRMTDAILELA